MSDQLTSINAKCSDMCYGQDLDTGKANDGYVNGGRGIGSGDYVDFTYCRNCGLIQGKFPVPPYCKEQEE